MDLKILNITKCKELVHSEHESYRLYYVYLPNLNKDSEQFIRQREPNMPLEYNQVVILSNNDAKFAYVNFKMDNDIENLKLNELSITEESFMMNYIRFKIFYTLYKMATHNYLEKHINLTRKIVENKPLSSSDLNATYHLVCGSWTSDLNILNITKIHLFEEKGRYQYYYVYLPNLSKECESLIRNHEKDMPDEYNQIVISDHYTSSFKYAYSTKTNNLSIFMESY